MSILNKHVYHYYEKKYGPLATLSALKDEEYIQMNRLQIMNISYQKYRNARIMIERVLLEQFVNKGGIPKDQVPLYFTVGEQPIIKNWYEETDFVMIPLSALPNGMISFTYGDSFIAFLRNDGHPTRRKLYTAQEIERIICDYGFDIKYNNMPTYIEMQLWDHSLLSKYI